MYNVNILINSFHFPKSMEVYYFTMLAKYWTCDFRSKPGWLFLQCTVCTANETVTNAGIPEHRHDFM